MLPRGARAITILNQQHSRVARVGDVRTRDSHYQLPLLPVDENFPFACGVGLLGSADPKEQSSSNCAGRCPARFQCPTEATYEALPCDAGHYCPEGTSVPLPCPAGSYSTATNLNAASECTDASPAILDVTATLAAGR